MSQSEADVAIVGGGVAGATLALFLAQAGKRVVILERGSAPVLSGADVLKPAGIEVVQKLGVFESLLAAGARRRSMLHVFHDGSLVTELDYRKGNGTAFFLLVPYATVLTTVLSALGELSNVEYRTSAAVSRFQLEGERMTSLELAGGERISARYYVGADGANSAVRECIGLQVTRDVYAQRMFFAKFPGVDSVEEVNRLYVDSSGGLAYFYPVGHDAFRAVLGFDEVEAAALVEKDANVLRTRLGQFVSRSADAIDQLGRLADFARIPVARMHASKYGKANVALLGDAIHNVHPITGQGMNLGIEDAGALGVALLAALESNADNGDWLEPYQAARWPINQAVVQYGHELATGLTARERFIASFNAQMQASRREHLHSAEQVLGVVAGGLRP